MSRAQLGPEGQIKPLIVLCVDVIIITFPLQKQDVQQELQL